MSTDEIKALVMRFVDEPWNKGNVDSIDEICAPEYVLHYITTGQLLGGREVLKQAVIDSRTNAPDFKVAVNEIIVEGDRVAYEWVMGGTENGKYKKTFGITILRLKDGKVVDDRFMAEDVKESEAVA